MIRTPRPSLSLALATLLLTAAPLFAEPAPQAAAPVVTLAEYRQRLQQLDQLVAACQAATTPENCRSAQVGPDAQVALPNGNRSIRFGWLRNLFDRTAKKPDPAANSAATETVGQSLTAARQRLAEDAQWAADNSIPASTKSQTAAATTAGRLAAILATPEYNSAAAQRSLKDRILEKIGNWIDRIFTQLTAVGAKSRWIGITAEIAFALLVCAALIWFLIRLERQGRLAPTSIRSGAIAGAPSARDWQLWLEDARTAAAAGAWREAIHLLYWASISRLESTGLWPADRARTPREYLALLPAQSPQQAGLAALTRSLEYTWYAGLAATQSDFQQAEQLATELTSGKAGSASRNTSRGTSRGSA